MSKQKKQKKQNKQINIQNKTISIVTPTTKNRTDCIQICLECILNQTYLSKINEWVIVSADKQWVEHDFYDFISGLQKKIHKNAPQLMIVGKFITDSLVKEEAWPSSNNYEAIGYLRNISNRLVSGDFIVCMDDDDYYPPKRVEHAVESLHNSDKDMAGCTKLIMYEMDLNTIYQWKGFGKNHSTNNCMAYKKSYIEKGFEYDSTKTFAEEKSFLDDHKTQMIQLNPEKTVIQMVHKKNTFNKRKLIISNAWMGNKANLYKVSSNPNAFIPKHMLEQYQSVLKPTEEYETNYDIVYYLGLGAPQWSPYDTTLGGSEQAVKYLVESWVSMGYRVAVYGDFKDGVEEETRNDVSNGDYFLYTKFLCSKQYNVLILWRKFGIVPLLSWPVNAKKLYVDLHDNVELTDVFHDNIDKIDKILVRSKYHEQMTCKINKQNNALLKKTLVIKNGVRLDKFQLSTHNYKRDPYRFCWCSCYTRGLAPLLQHVWPIIKQNEPRAEFHIYYGMDGVRDMKFKNAMRSLLQQPGVCDHGRQSVEMVVREKYRSTFHLYFSCTTAETDCISIRESACVGCIPVLSKYNVFGERKGLHLRGNPNDEKDLHAVAHMLIALLHDSSKCQQLREDMQNIDQEVSWLDIARQWPIGPLSNSNLKDKDDSKQQ